MCEVARLAVDAVLRIRDSGNLDYIQILQKPGGSLQDSFLEEGFLLEKSSSVDQQHACARGQHREGGGDRRGGEGEDAREGESDSGARDGRVHQSAADLQLPRAAADGRGEGEHRARGLRGRGTSGGGAGRFVFVCLDRG